MPARQHPVCRDAKNVGYVRTNAMRIVFTYTKGYEVKYLGHLDLMRVFERALRRTSLPLKYSEGFNPRIKLAFALPLPVGVEGESEMGSLELSVYSDPVNIMRQLNAVLPPGIKLIDVKRDIYDLSLALMVRSARYIIHLDSPIHCDQVQQMLAQPTLYYDKKSKHRTKQVDLKLHLFDCVCQDNQLDFTVKAGAELNIRPDEVLRLLLPDQVPLRIIRRALFLERTWQNK